MLTQWIATFFVLTATISVATAQPTKEIVRGRYAYIEIAHEEQSPDLCLPTCVAMALNYYGAGKSQWTIKRLSNEHKDLFSGTSLEEVQQGIKPLGYTWDRWRWRADSMGFVNGLDAIKQSLDRGKPVIIGIHVERDVADHRRLGHALLAFGYDAEEREIMFMDPAQTFPGKRHVSYDHFREMWNQGGQRLALFTAAEGDLPVGHPK